MARTIRIFSRDGWNYTELISMNGVVLWTLRENGTAFQEHRMSPATDALAGWLEISGQFYRVKINSWKKAS